MSIEEIKKEKFKAVPEGATIEQHNFEGEYEKSDQYLVKDGEKYKIIERSMLIHGTLKDLDQKKSKDYDKFSEEDKKRKIEKDDKLCNFVCEKCEKLGKECKLQHFKDEKGRDVEADYYQRDIEIIENGKKKIITMNYLKPISLKKIINKRNV